MKLFKKKQDIAGIYIEDNSITICQLKPGQEPQVEKIIDVSLPEGTVKNGIILKLDILIKTIKGCFRKNNIKSKRVAVTVSDLPLIIRPAAYPKVPEEKIKEALKPEVDKYMVGEEPIIDYCSLEKDKILLFSIKKALANSLLSVMGKAGLDLVAIDIESLSVLRTLVDSNIDPTSKDTSMLVLVFPHKLELIIITKGLPQYLRSVDVENIANIIREVELTKKSWEEQSSQSPIKKIIILGSDSRAKDLFVELPEEIGALEVAQPLGSPPDKYTLSQSTSIGLALRGKKTFPFDINFVPPEKHKKLQIKRRFFSVFTSLSIILICIFATNLILSGIISSIHNKLIPIKRDLDTYQHALTQIEEVYETKKILIKGINYRKEFLSKVKRLPLALILDDIRKFIPQEVWLTKVSHKSEGSVILTGESFSQEAVYKYNNLLYFSDYFKDPKVSDITTKEEVFHFSILCPLLNEKGNNED